MSTKRDGMRVGGILSGVLTVPSSELHKVCISGLGEVIYTHDVCPGDEFSALYRSQVDDEEIFDGAGIAVEVPDLDAGHQALVAFTGRHNAFVNQGLQRVLDSAYNGLTAARITHIGLSADDQAVTTTTSDADPVGGASGSSIKTIANVSRTNQTVHVDQTWTQADVSWAIRKIFMATAASSSAVVNIIGGTGGASPYNEPFNIDLTSIASWSLTMGIDTTASAS